MATLTAGINSTIGQFAVSGDVSAAVPGTEYRIDDEVITLRSFLREPLPWSPRNRSKWIVSRGMAGTAAATHLADAAIVGTEEAVTTGTTLTRPEPFAGEGGTPQTVSQLGPFAFAFDDVGITTSAGFVVTAEVPAGATIINTWIEITDDWTFPAPAALALKVFPNSDAGDTYQMVEYDTNPQDDFSIQGDAKVVIEASHADGSTPPLRFYQARVTEISSVAVCALPETPTAGAGLAYVLIATSS